MSKNPMSLSELKKQAEELFKTHTEVKKVYAFSDGNLFLDTHKNAAELHKRTTQTDWTEIENEAALKEEGEGGEGGEGGETKDPQPSKSWNNEKLIAWIVKEEIATEEQLKDLKKVEMLAMIEAHKAKLAADTK